ncbi:aldolase/citrate lyase family protein [Superficieibacter sp. HKU1]|uniref:HpcH/HpaI aldolase family protein n=1 Tax=Superficieibacter sp. HKU1 TaxID=3031919 RepID=UPI0023E0D18A|nr:aldolase/citrate lyase family protein [Superficieibacter sp. HKU1]WES68362.1 aldolase/citrate lyase family protein [Superficieibacter sp. HKU1]
MNNFKQAILAGQRMLGTWMMTGSDTVAEAMATVGFDFLVLDQEHVAVDTLEAIRIDRAIRSVNPLTTPLYRLAGNEVVLLKRALDGGAMSLMIPFINTVEDARKAVESAYYPPYGKRGFAAMHRASGWGGNAQFVREAREDLCLILQLETPEAIANVGAMAEIEGITGFFIGPGDLSSAMGHPGNPSHPDVQAMIKRGLDACKQLGKPCGIVGGNPELVNRYQQMGFTFVALASDMSFLISRAKEQLGAIRGEDVQIRGGEVY